MDLTQIKAFAFDIDGVATDGGVQCTTDGDLLRTYDAKDGFAIRMASMNGYPIAVITGGSSETIRKRMIVSGVKPEDIFLHCRDKRIEFGIFCERYHLDPKDVMYFGDDGTVLSQNQKLLIQKMADTMGVSFQAFYNRLRELDLFEYKPVEEYVHQSLRYGGEAHA